VRWLNVDEYRWVYEIIWAEASKAKAWLQFEILPMCDAIRLAMHDSQEAGFFRWRADTIPADLTRKISITVPLNDAAEYEGGVLEFRSGAIQRLPQVAGARSCFRAGYCTE